MSPPNLVRVRQVTIWERLRCLYVCSKFCSWTRFHKPYSWHCFNRIGQVTSRWDAVAVYWFVLRNFHRVQKSTFVIIGVKFETLFMSWTLLILLMKKTKFKGNISNDWVMCITAEKLPAGLHCKLSSPSLFTTAGNDHINRSSRVYVYTKTLSCLYVFIGLVLHNGIPVTGSR